MSQTVLSVLADDPSVLLLQTGVLSAAAVLLFILFWTVRDALLRSRSFGFHLFALLVVTVLPLFGFLVYLLVRPIVTLREREMEKILRSLEKDLHARNGKQQKKAKE